MKIARKITSGMAVLASKRDKVDMLLDGMLTPARMVKYAASSNLKLRRMMWETINLNPERVIGYMTDHLGKDHSPYDPFTEKLLQTQEASAHFIARAVAKLVRFKRVELESSKGHYEEEWTSADSTGNWITIDHVWVEDKPAVYSMGFDRDEIYSTKMILGKHDPSKQKEVLTLLDNLSPKLSVRLRVELKLD